MICLIFSWLILPLKLRTNFSREERMKRKVNFFCNPFAQVPMLANGLQFAMHSNCQINPVWNIVSSIYYNPSKLYFVASKVLECLRFGKSFDCFNFTIRYLESILIKTFQLFKYITNNRAVGVNLSYGNELIINYTSLKCESRFKRIYISRFPNIPRHCWDSNLRGILWIPISNDIVQKEEQAGVGVFEWSIIIVAGLLEAQGVSVKKLMDGQIFRK